ncbi:DUF3431 domain-containing protein [Salidesulfovibrio brasiliensis]|uniref:DUF3431 domain-containing protein n=1 Tax=Salidesulfovibrio brasiliensis TaxID=221711 RepID=UPI0006D00C42|nr:DUF3431 domain-containing protein [Salidesulfovibrio brasiliensis]
MNGVHLIIARYREDVEWVDALGYPATVYDKSGDPLPGTVPLPNIGREAHTYLTHIIRHYDELADLNVFLQGGPFDHLFPHGGTPDDLRAAIAGCRRMNRPFTGLAWFKLDCDGLGRPHDLKKPENEGRWNGWGRDIPVAEIFEKLFAAETPERFIARGATGNFAVRAERIRTRPRAFYEYALSLIEADPGDHHNTGHAFERLWHLIFNGYKVWNRESYPVEG